MNCKKGYEKRKAAGICTACGKTRDGNGNKCAACEAMQAKRNRIQYARRRPMVEQWRASGVCTACGKRKAKPKKSCCAKCILSAKTSRNKRVARGLCSSCGGIDLVTKRLCRSCVNRQRLLGMSIRDEVFAAYGGYRCVCCGETMREFLQIDHIDGNGASMRKEQGIGWAFYRWLKRHGYPSGYQILCANCNIAKHRFGVCPHQRAK